MDNFLVNLEKFFFRKPMKQYTYGEIIVLNKILYINNEIFIISSSSMEVPRVLCLISSETEIIQQFIHVSTTSLDH